MKANRRSGKNFKNFRFCTALVLLSGMYFLILPSCLEYIPDSSNQESVNKSGSLMALKMAKDSIISEKSLLLGHKIFKRSTGTPILETQEILNPKFNCYDGNFVLNIQNGTDKKTRVASGEIKLDGVEIIGPSDFSKNVTVITKKISGLTSDSKLEIKLNSTPGSFIDLWIEGTLNLVVPVFDKIGPLCQNSTPPPLPSTSANSKPVKGTWNPATISTATPGKTKYAFTPDIDQCGVPTTMEIEVVSPVIPVFTQIGPLLLNSTPPVLPAKSNNGISGKWSPDVINTTTAGIFTFTFTPDADQCATITTMKISIGVVADNEGNIYKIVKIGDQIWMAENLRATKYNNGNQIETTTPATLNITAENNPKYQWSYNGDAANDATYGRLYTWYAASDNRNVCPTGWHVPTDTEWTALSGYLTNNGFGFGGSGDDIGKSLAAKSLWTADVTAGNVGNDQASNNNSGFTALPAANRNSNGQFTPLGTYAGWWSFSENTTTTAWYRALNYNQSVMVRGGDGDKKNGGSVRCIKDN